VNRAISNNERVLILGGGGMVGVEVAREMARQVGPKQIVVTALTQKEADDAVDELRRDAKREKWKTEFVAASGDIFIPHSLQGRSRGDLVSKRELFDELFQDIFSPTSESHRTSHLYHLVSEHRPNVVIDCINTATAISYQDVFTTSRKVKVLLDRFENEGSLPAAEIPRFVESVREVLIAQGVPQITRHIMTLYQTLRDADVRVYVKVGTTGTGGMGINIPYTHSEDRPSATLLSKSAIGFAHTGLLFLLARTPGTVRDGSRGETPMFKEVKPGAMIGFKRLAQTHVKLTGASGRREPGYLLTPREEPLGSEVEPRHEFTNYPRLEPDVPVRIVGADTGENGFFSIGEFQAITYPRQMEYVTPEEVARTTVLEIIGASTGRDVLAAIDGAITEPSYRAGVLRDAACRELDRLEALLAESDANFIPSIALGHLGPPRLSKLLIEAYLLRAAAGSDRFEEMVAISPTEMRRRVEEYLATHSRVASLVATIGIPILRGESGTFSIARGPRLNIPVPLPDGRPVPLDDDSVERFAFLGWVDLREKNFRQWNERLELIVKAHPDIAANGSAAFDTAAYMPEIFSPGDVVGWLLSNEIDEQGMVGHRLY
jgi:hypothetical protein